jgi:hypothetical protein
MNLKRAFLVGLIAVIPFARAAAAADRMRVASVPLDMPLEDTEALDNQALEGLYQGDYGKNMKLNVGGYLPDNVKSSGLTDAPFKFITTLLEDGRTLQLWFSSAEDGRKTFGVSLETPYIEKPTRDFGQALSEIQSVWGKPDLEFSPPEIKTQQIDVFVDRTMPQERLAAVTAHLPKVEQLAAKDRNDFWDTDLRDYARILGGRFRGAIIVANQQNGKLVAEKIMLIDLVRARTVFNLDNVGGRPK